MSIQKWTTSSWPHGNYKKNTIKEIVTRAIYEMRKCRIIWYSQIREFEGILKSVSVPKISAKWSFGLWLNASWWEIHSLLSHCFAPENINNLLLVNYGYSILTEFQYRAEIEDKCLSRICVPPYAIALKFLDSCGIKCSFL